MRTRRTYEDHGTLVELDGTPFLYLAFTLLIVLLVALPAAGRKAVSETPPPAEPAKAVSGHESDTHTIGIDRLGLLKWDGEPTDRESLSARLLDLGAQGWQGGILVETDHALPVEDAVDVLDLVTANGLRKAGIVVRPEPKPARPIPLPVPPPFEPEVKPAVPVETEPPDLGVSPDAPTTNVPPP